MLPGLRFLFAAVVLSVSLLIFGLGAAALLRAAHQEFVSLPSRPQPAEKLFAVQNDVAMPSLAMLRVDAPIEDEEAHRVPETANPQVAAEPVDPPSIAATTARWAATLPEEIASPIIASPALQEPSRLEAQPSAPEIIVRNEPTPEAETTSSVQPNSSSENTIAATESQQLPASDPASIAPEQTEPPVANDAISTKLATLGGPAVEIETPASPTKAKSKPRKVESKKQLRAERAIQRRKVVRRASTLRRATQVASDPFGAAQPFAGFPGITPNRR